MLIYFLAGLSIGLLGLGIMYLRSYKKSVNLEAVHQKILEEKRIIVNFIHKLSDAIQANISRQSLFELILHTAVISTGASSGCIYELKEDRMVSVAIEGLFPPQSPDTQETQTTEYSKAAFIKKLIEKETLSFPDSLIGKVAQTGEALFIPRAETVADLPLYSDPLLKIHSLMAIPIKARQAVVGVIAVCNPVQYPYFKKIDFSLVQSLVDQAGMAINQLDLISLQIEKNKIDFDLSLARNIQSMLLPKVIPFHPSLAISPYYEAAQKVGGDLYDIFELDAGRIGIAVADVSGKGIPASLVMAICQTSLRQYAQAYQSPAAVLKALNKTMHSSIAEDMFITMVYAVINLRHNTLTWARAGHEKPLLLKNTTASCPQVTLLASEGMALGIVESELFDTVIEEQTLPFVKDDTLVLYTDGLTEVFNSQGEQFSTASLMDILKDYPEGPPKDLNTYILKHLRQYSGSHTFPDDLTVVTLKHL